MHVLCWSIESTPKSYLKSGFCFAGHKAFIEFLVEYSYEKQLMSIFEHYKLDETVLTWMLDITVILWLHMQFTTEFSLAK